MRIRQATEVDASAIEEVHSRAIQAIDRSFYSDTEIASWSGRVNPVGKQPFSEVLVTSICLVAEQEGRLVGFAQLAAEEGEVRAVYVLPESGGQGIGGLLLARIEAIARELKIEELELKSSLNAVPFYEAHGYEQLGETTHGLADGIQLRCVRMRKVVALPR